MASFRQTPYGWRAEVTRRGVRRSASAFRTKAAAVAWANRIESEIMAGIRGEVPNLTVAALLRRYREEVSTTKKGARWEIIRLSAWERDTLARVSLRRLDAPHVSDWQRRRLKAVSSASVRRERNLLNNVFEIARKEWRWVQRNPFEGVRRPKDGKARTRIASDAELQLLLARASPALHRAIVAALETAMRAGEIASKPQIEGRVAYLADTKNGEPRQVPLSERAIEVLDGGIPLTAGSISAEFARLCKAVGIRGLTFHDLRRTAIVRLSKRLDAFELAKMVGHRDLKMTLNVYYKADVSEMARKLE